jgi:LysR family transcriptional regulator, glycine cleavage system transcriptional activator
LETDEPPGATRTQRLVRPFALALDVSYGYWIVCPTPFADLPKISTFREWLVAEAADDARRMR